MNKKVTIVAITLIAAMMLSSVALVLAAPKEEVDFALYLRGALAGDMEWCHEMGYLVVSPDNRWVLPQVPPPEGYVVWHFVNAPFDATFYELVVNGETFPMERLDLTSTVSGTANWLTSHLNVKVDETVTIYTDETKSTVWGTIEMRSVKQNEWPVQPLGLGGNFVGHGTGALSGVKVHGDAGTVDYGGLTTRSRIGTAMGWPGWP